MMRHSVIVILAAICGHASADSIDVPHLDCHNRAALWDFSLLGDQAQLRFAGKTTDYDLAHTTAADPAPWPVALTFVGRDDTAIVIVDQIQDEFSVHILTQRRQTPVLLHGACVHPSNGVSAAVK